MTRWSAAALTLAIVVGSAAGQQYPDGRVVGGPIIGLDGKPVKGIAPEVSPWSGALEFGLGGSEGNVQLLKGRAGLDFAYKDSDFAFLFNGLYVLTRYNNEPIEQKGLFGTRTEIAFDAVWAYYAQAQFEYDEFRDIDLRAGAHNGVSFTAFRSTGYLVKLRGGVGTIREWGGDRNEFIPETQVGGDFELVLTQSSKLSATLDYYSEFDDFSRYRVRGRASIDIMLDPELNMLLRLGVIDRYDSHPLRSKKNDLDYFVSLLFQF